MRNHSWRHGLEPVSLRERRSWTSEPPVDASGRPTSDLVTQILTLIFERPGTAHTLDDLAHEVFCDPRHVLALLCQLRAIDLVEETAPHSLVFRTTRNPWNRRLFARVRDRFAQTQTTVPCRRAA